MAAATGTEPAVVIRMGAAQQRENPPDLPVVVTDPEDAELLPNFEHRSKIRDRQRSFLGGSSYLRLWDAPAIHLAEALHVIVRKANIRFQ